MIALYTLSKKVAEVCHKVGEFQLEQRMKVQNTDVSDKGLNQLVSYVDVESEKMLVSELVKLMPQAGFITEEGTREQAGRNEIAWIIDPLDGTTNYLHRLPVFSISVALIADGDVVLGVVHIPAWKETFIAVKGYGAFKNGEKISVSRTESLSSSLLATGFPYYEFDQMDAYLKTLKQLMNDTRGLRRMGSAAIDLVYVANGYFDGFFETGLNAWDVAAGELIVREAGGTVSDFQSGDDYIFGKSIIASNRKLHAQIAQIIQSHFQS